MATILSELYASGGDDVILHTIELSCEAWTNPVCLVRDFVNHTMITEDLRELEFVGCGMDVALPKRDATGAQNLTFAIDGIRTEAAKLLRAAIADQKAIKLTYRCYVFSDLTAPAEAPTHMVVRSYKAQSNHVEVTAGVFDLIDMRWPRRVYNSLFSPGLKYMQ